MQLNVAENIKKFRKEMGLTQEDLSEAFGVTVGAVSKWESGASIPDIMTLIELADFFSISTDVLLGFTVSSKSIEDIVDKLGKLIKANRHDEALSEADKALVRYPANFKIIFGCATVYHVVSAATGKKEYIRKTIELYETALRFVSQNSDPDVSEFSIRLNIAELKSKDDPLEALEELKRVNYMGIADVNIAMIQMNTDMLDEALERYTKVLLSILLKSLQYSSNMAVALMKTGKRKSFGEACDVLDWGISLFDATSGRQLSYLTKMKVVLLVIKSMCLSCLDDREKMRSCIDEACRLAKEFDKDPTNEVADRIRFWHGAKDYKPAMYDELGRGAVESIENLFHPKEAIKAPEKVVEKIEIARNYWDEIKGR